MPSSTPDNLSHSRADVPPHDPASFLSHDQVFPLLTASDRVIDVSFIFMGTIKKLCSTSVSSFSTVNQHFHSAQTETILPTGAESLNNNIHFLPIIKKKSLKVMEQQFGHFYNSKVNLSSGTDQQNIKAKHQRPGRNSSKSSPVSKMERREGLWKPVNPVEEQDG